MLEEADAGWGAKFFGFLIKLFPTSLIVKLYRIAHKQAWVRRRHLSARKTAESDGAIVNSMGRLACTLSPHLLHTFFLCFVWRRGGMLL